jgi:DNA-binding transcriptional regulator YbjK
MVSRAEKPHGDVRNIILKAARDLVRSQGMKALTQPRVAKLAGVRQSHLTYYFPRKTDLLMALFEDSHHQAAAHSSSGDADAAAFLGKLMFDRDRARFFFSAALAAAEDSELRASMASHMRGLAEMIAPDFGRRPDDPAVVAFVDLLRGAALRWLLEGKNHPAPDTDALAAMLGLSRKP